jgi:hypothetical protein
MQGQLGSKKALFSPAPRRRRATRARRKIDPALRRATVTVHTMLLLPPLLLLLTACLAATVRASGTCSFPDGGAASGNLSCAPLGATFAPTALTA